MTRVPVKGGGGSPRWGWTHDPDAYPIFTLADRRRLAFGPADTKHRTRGEIDRAWSNLPGLVVVDPGAVDPGTGAAGWRILPAEVIQDDDEGGS